MMDYRIADKEVRMEYFELYFYWSLRLYDADPAMFLLNYINTRMELNEEQRFWVAWLYGNTYQLPTAWVIANEFPDYENVDLERLTIWNNNNYKRLRYQMDQKWQKGHLPEMFESYKHHIQSQGDSTQKSFFNSVCNKKDPVKNFNALYKFIVKYFHKFGRYSAWFYIQTLKETCGLNVEAPDLLLTDPNTHTQRDGLCRALALDDWVGDTSIRENSEAIAQLNAGAVEILNRMHKKYPELRSDMFLLETILCAFKKTFRVSKGRYLGYYLDRQAQDIQAVQKDGWDGIDWDLLWQGRNEILDPRTVRVPNAFQIKMDMSYFLNTGKIKYIDYVL